MDDENKLVDASPWHPIQDAVDLKHLGKLGEELGEAQAAICRCIIQGIDEEEPVTGVSNRTWLENELADVMANINLVALRFELNEDRMNVRAAKKMAHLKQWHDMA